MWWSPDVSHRDSMVDAMFQQFRKEKREVPGRGGGREQIDAGRVPSQVARVSPLP